MGMPDILPPEYFVPFHGPARADQLPFAEEVGDGLLDLDAGQGAGDDERVIPDAQCAAAQIIRIEQRRLGGGYQPDFPVWAGFRKDTEAITVDACPELNLRYQHLGGLEEGIDHG